MSNVADLINSVIDEPLGREPLDIESGARSGVVVVHHGQRSRGPRRLVD